MFNEQERGMDETDFKEPRRQIMPATLELEAKALNYLLVANMRSSSEANGRRWKLLPARG